MAFTCIFAAGLPVTQAANGREYPIWCRYFVRAGLWDRASTVGGVRSPVISLPYVPATKYEVHDFKTCISYLHLQCHIYTYLGTECPRPPRPIKQAVATIEFNFTIN